VTFAHYHTLDTMLGMIVLKMNSHEAVPHAALAIESGGVVIYPTDTLYGLGADALSDSAVKKIYEVKGRDEGKPIHAIVADMQMAERFAYVDGTAHMLAERFLPGPLTLILKKREGIETGIAKGIDTFGIRIPDNAFCKDLVEKFGGPITTTSANRAGMHAMRTVKEIVEQLGERAQFVDCAIDAGEIPARRPSTVVDCSGERPIILREGAISSQEIWDALVELED
jgi:L-threonylcarbamoyladenylate synthase